MITSKLKGIALFISLLVILIPIVHATELNLVYDQNGNLLYGDGKYREYNSLNQLVRIRSSDNSTILEEYVHHPMEERIYIKKVYNSSNQVAETVIYFSKTFVRVKNATGTYDFTYVKDENGNLVGQINADGSKFYVHGDHEGSTSIVTNSSGQVIENTTYSPFGEILGGGEASRFDSEGKEFDTLVGDYDFHFRKMNPSWGLFLQPDTLIPNVYDPQSLNRYMFERGNPYKNVDKDGHNPLLVGALVYIGLRSLYGGLAAGISDYNDQSDSGGNTDWSRVGIQVLKGLGKGAVIGTVEGGIVAAGVLGGGILAPVGGAGTALFVGEELIDPLWDISYKEKSKLKIEQKMVKDQNQINKRNQVTNVQATITSSGKAVSQSKTGGGSTFGSSSSGSNNKPAGKIITLGGKRYRCRNC